MRGEVIRLEGQFLYINEKQYVKPSNNKLRVNDNGIFCGIYELKNDKWSITRRSLKELWKE